MHKHLWISFVWNIVCMYWLQGQGMAGTRYGLVLGSWTSWLQCQLQTGSNPTSPKWDLDTYCTHHQLPIIHKDGSLRLYWVSLHSGGMRCDSGPRSLSATNKIWSKRPVTMVHSKTRTKYKATLLYAKYIWLCISIHINKLLVWCILSWNMFETCSYEKSAIFFHISSWQNHRQASRCFVGKWSSFLPSSFNKLSWYQTTQPKTSCKSITISKVLSF